MNSTEDLAPLSAYRPGKAFLIALVLAVLTVAALALLTNRMALEWDMSYYLDMARHGIRGNHNLAAPFAYRFAAPLLVGGIARLFGTDTELTFRVACALMCLAFILSSFYFAKLYGASDKAALLSSFLLALYFYIIKWTLFSGTMVDIFAYPIVILAFWALLREEFYWCLAISTVGLFFKEFLLLPILTQAIVLLIRSRKTDWRKTMVPLLTTGVVLLACFLVPRLFIHVARTFQDIDPINERSSLRRLIWYPMSRRHDFNIIFAYLACWLPVVLLLTVARWRVVWSHLRKYRLAIGIYMALHFCLVMYGGTNLDIYPTYCLPLQVMMLVILIDRCQVSKWEWITAIVLVILFNRLWMHLPLPQDNLDTYLDFYGGYYMRVNTKSFLRMGELLIYIAGFWTSRLVLTRMRKAQFEPVAT